MDLANNLDRRIFEETVRRYLNHVRTSDWYSAHEIYKFRFGRWINDRVNLQIQTDQEALNICRDSQLERYRDDSRERGINFITANLRFKDAFIDLEDIRALRQLSDVSIDPASALEGFPPKLTYPKFAVWAASILPNLYIPYGIDELTGPIATFFGLKEIKTRGSEGFLEAQRWLRIVLAELRKFESEFTDALAKHLGDTKLRDVDWSWLTADLLFFLKKKDEVPAYFWVCQGENYAVERKGNFIWAHSNTNHHHHKRVAELKAGDRILHYADGAIRAVSTVRSKPLEAEYPVAGTRSGQPGLKVDVEYEDIEPISSKEVFDRLKGEEDSLPAKYSPLAPGGTINQGYLFDFSADAFERVLDPSRYWVFQCNPKKFDIVQALKDNAVERWRVVAHADKIKPGDKVILWASGPDSGVYALATVKSKPEIRPTSERSSKYSPEGSFVEAVPGVDLSVDHSFADSPISADEIRANPATKDLKGGTQGTNFSATRAQYDAIVAMASRPTVGRETTNSKEKVIEMETVDIGPLNQIFYGPPGTGKTYHLQRSLFGHFRDGSSTITREQYLIDLVKDLPWWQVITTVLLDIGRSKVRSIEEHELLQARIRSSKSNSVTQTIWVQLQQHAHPDCPEVKYGSRLEPGFFWKYDDSTWEARRELVEDAAPELLELLAKSKSQPPPGTSSDRYQFVTFHQSFSYEDFVEGIKPTTDEETGQIKYEVRDGILKKLADRARRNPEKPYALFIDEINRGNVASIFGELITLIEDDKREGAANPLSVTLPYSQETFSLPSNLYIFGTMNTADRSVEALDTALRRRFTFTSVNADLDFFGRERIKVGKVDLQSLLSTINSRLERLLDRDHTIGHAYFVSLSKATDGLTELKLIFNNKILPLLKEYFFGDFGKIGLVLGEAFLSEVKLDSPFADFDHHAKGDFEERKVYELKDAMNLSEKDFISIYQ